MLFSTILGSYYQIKCSDAVSNSIDLHFTGAAHHRLLWCDANFKHLLQEAEFHENRHLDHVQRLKEVIHLFGDFSELKDPANEGFDFKARWSPQRLDLPPHTFAAMKADSRFGIGEGHPNDAHLSRKGEAVA